jgi:hypothetical protein
MTTRVPRAARPHATAPVQAERAENFEMRRRMKASLSGTWRACVEGEKLS